MKIVLGFDDSPHAQAALTWIRTQSWPAGTKVKVVSVVRAPMMAYAEVSAPAIPYPVGLVEELTKHHEELATKAESTLRAAGYDASSSVVQGDPREILVDTAASEHADLIVVGSHGRTGLAKLLIGSVASHVVAHAKCNVLVVKKV